MTQSRPPRRKISPRIRELQSRLLWAVPGFGTDGRRRIVTAPASDDVTDHPAQLTGRQLLNVGASPKPRLAWTGRLERSGIITKHRERPDLLVRHTEVYRATHTGRSMGDVSALGKEEAASAPQGWMRSFDHVPDVRLSSERESRRAELPPHQHRRQSGQAAGDRDRRSEPSWQAAPLSRHAGGQRQRRSREQSEEGWCGRRRGLDIASDAASRPPQRRSKSVVRFSESAAGEQWRRRSRSMKPMCRRRRAASAGGGPCVSFLELADGMVLNHSWSSSDEARSDASDECGSTVKPDLLDRYFYPGEGYFDDYFGGLEVSSGAQSLPVERRRPGGAGTLEGALARRYRRHRAADLNNNNRYRAKSEARASSRPPASAAASQGRAGAADYRRGWDLPALPVATRRRLQLGKYAASPGRQLGSQSCECCSTWPMAALRPGESGATALFPSP